MRKEFRFLGLLLSVLMISLTAPVASATAYDAGPAVDNWIGAPNQDSLGGEGDHPAQSELDDPEEPFDDIASTGQIQIWTADGLPSTEGTRVHALSMSTIIEFARLSLLRWMAY